LHGKTADETANVPTHSFNANGIDLTHSEISDFAPHLLGDDIARKMTAVRNRYVRRYSTSVGFSNNSVEIAKPAIYNSITRIDTYLRRAVSRNNISHEEAAKHLARCLDVAYVAYFENSTELEAKLRKTRDALQLLEIFEGVELTKN